MPQLCDTSSDLIYLFSVDFASTFLPRCENLPIGFNSSSFKHIRKFTGRKMVSKKNWDNVGVL